MKKVEHAYYDKSFRKKEPIIILNSIKTPDGTILISHHRHDYVTYIDKNGLEYMVDGGTDYLRRNVHNNAPYIEMSIYSNSPFKIIRNSLYRGGRGKDGKQSLTWVVLSEMSDKWVKACIEYNEAKEQLGESFSTKCYKKELKYRIKHNITIND